MSPGLNGVGKMIAACTSLISWKLDVGSVAACGPDAMKWLGDAWVLTSSIG